MSFRNPLNHWRGPELKDPLIRDRALLGRKVRLLLAKHPEGMTRTELNAQIEGAGCVVSHLRKMKFAKMSPSNAKANGTRGELWFASSPDDPCWAKNEGPH